MIAKQAAIDPASAIKQMREQWELTEDEHDRYALRVRTNAAMRESIDLISFDSVEETFTVMLYGGLRAYKFPNVKNIRKAGNSVEKIVPQVVDAIPFMDENRMKPYLNAIGPNTTPQMDEFHKNIDKGLKVRVTSEVVE